MFTDPYINVVFLVSYAASIFVGLPIALYLFMKNKCSYKNLAGIGFILGFISLFIFNFYLKTGGDVSHLGIKFNEVMKFAVPSIWNGICAALGATLFGYISGFSALYNKSLKKEVINQRAF